MGEKFRTIWGNDLEFPGDPNAPAKEVINCHCVMVPDVATEEERKSLQSNGGNGIIEIEGQRLLSAEKDLQKQKTSSIRKAIATYERRIAQHEDKIAFPERYDVGWNEKDDGRKRGLLNHWQKEINGFRKSIARREAELNRRGES